VVSKFQQTKESHRKQILGPLGYSVWRETQAFAFLLFVFIFKVFLFI
jgi:hypothetical protein